MEKDTNYDVTICGAGLAGLTLAYQLVDVDPDFSVAVIDKDERPLNDHAHKVGESTIPPGSTYLGPVLGLSEYFAENHVPKLGLRWYFGDSEKLLNERAEVGVQNWNRLLTWNFSRGQLENDLREMVEERGAAMYEGYTVRGVEVAEGDRDHSIMCRDPDGNDIEIGTKWLVDALGRRHMLRSELGLEKDVETYASSSWFRVRPNLTPASVADESDEEWFDRIDDSIDGARNNSTNHIVGDGYWVWLIDLSGDATSVGIVAHKDYHSFSDFNTADRALEWLEEHEPRIADAVEEREQLDFRCMREYSFNSTQFLSGDRWALAGEAATFADPWFSLQTNFIGKSNCMIADAIRSDLEHGELDPQNIKQANINYLGEVDTVIHNFETIYRCFENSVATMCTIMWIYCIGTFQINSIQDGVFEPGNMRRDNALAKSEDEQKLGLLNARVAQLFDEWAQRSERNLEMTAYTDYIDEQPYLDELRRKSVAGEAAEIATLEALAQAIFLVAVEDTMPERLEEFEGAEWLDVWNLTLDTDKWEEIDLLEPRTPVGDLEWVYRPLRNAFKRKGGEASGLELVT